MLHNLGIGLCLAISPPNFNNKRMKMFKRTIVTINIYIRQSAKLLCTFASSN